MTDPPPHRTPHRVEHTSGGPLTAEQQRLVTAARAGDGGKLARALLDENPNPTEHEIRTAISGAICRCTGYKNIVGAVRWAADYEAANRQEQEVG